MRFFTSHGSADSAVVVPGRTPSSMSARFNQLCSEAPETPKSLAISTERSVTLAGDSDNVTTETRWIGMGHGHHPFVRSEILTSQIGNQTFSRPHRLRSDP